MTVTLDRPQADLTAQDSSIAPAAAAAPEDASFESLLRTVESMDVPDGFRAEISGGTIVMSPWSQGYYLDVMDELVHQLSQHAPADHRASSSPALYAFAAADRAYGPDVHVAHRAARRTRDIHLDGESLSLVAELTSGSTRTTDWGDKLTVYGRSGVPVYLLLDMQKESVSAFWNPGPEGYTANMTVPFGTPLPLPAPFSFELDTAGFAAPAEPAPAEGEDGGQPPEMSSSASEEAEAQS